MAKGYFHSHQTNPSQWKIAIQPGYRTVNIGRTSNPLPILIPNVFARRPCQSHPKTNSSSSSHSTNTIRTKYHSHMHAIKSHQLHSATIVVRHPHHPCLESAQSCSTKAGSPRSLSSHVSSLPHEVLMSLAKSRGVHTSFLPESGSKLAVLAGYFLLAKPSLSLSRLANFKVLHG
ncbi:hypothetical protein PtB15_8B156 [Puccinia triticina]|nr:hypothetical protein PtB15_8B156 [Puccinia triticina]